MSPGAACDTRKNRDTYLTGSYCRVDLGVTAVVVVVMVVVLEFPGGA